MAIQFPDYAGIIINGSNAGANLMNAKVNSARAMGEAMRYGADAVGASVGEIIRRQREKKAAQMLEEATEEKRRYMAGEFKDADDEKRLSSLYSIPESEQFARLSARVAPYSSSLAQALEKQAQIRAGVEGDVLKMGGDPKTIRLENQIRSLNEQRKAVVGLEGLNIFNLNGNLEQLRKINKAIDSANRKMGESLGISSEGTEKTAPEGAEETETEEQEFELTPDAGKIAVDKILALKTMTSADEVKAYLDEVAKDETLAPSVRWAISSYGIPYYKQLLAQDSGLLQLEQSKQRLEMDKANRLFSPFEGDAARYGAEYSSLVELLNRWGDPPANFAEAKMRLQLLGSALQSVQAVAGTTKEDSSIVDMIRKAIGLADRDQITAEAYNGAVSGIVDAVFGRAKGHNANVSKSLKMADTPYAKAFGERLLIDIGEKPSFGLATKDYFSKDESKDVSPSGGTGGPTPEEIETRRKILGLDKDGGK